MKEEQLKEQLNEAVELLKWWCSSNGWKSFQRDELRKQTRDWIKVLEQDE